MGACLDGCLFIWTVVKMGGCGTIASGVGGGERCVEPYRGTSLIRNNPSLGPYSRLMPRALWWS